MTHRHNTTLDTHTAATLRAYGGGNLSQGIRRAAELVRQWEEANAHLNSTPVPEWQPIENAPKDGRAILGWAEGVTTTVYWHSSLRDWELCECGAFAMSAVFSPVFWMPVPQDPTSEPGHD